MVEINPAKHRYDYHIMLPSGERIVQADNHESDNQSIMVTLTLLDDAGETIGEFTGVTSWWRTEASPDSAEPVDT